MAVLAKPLQPACDTQPTLIEIDRGRDELLADAFQSGVSSGDKLTGGCEHDRLSKLYRSFRIAATILPNASRFTSFSIECLC